jgi:NADPH2:quinone reductase
VARELTGGRGVDLVVDGVGGKTLSGSIKCLAYRGRAVSFGQAGRDFSRPDVGLLSEANRSLTGVSLAMEVVLQPDRVRGMIDGHLRDVTAGSLKVVTDRSYPLSEAAEAHAYIESRQAFGRVVLVP